MIGWSHDAHEAFIDEGEVVLLPPPMPLHRLLLDPLHQLPVFLLPLLVTLHYAVLLRQPLQQRLVRTARLQEHTAPA